MASETRHTMLDQREAQSNFNVTLITFTVLTIEDRQDQQAKPNPHPVPARVR